MPSETPRQPLLHGETVVLRAPTQAWSAADGSIGGQLRIRELRITNRGKPRKSGGYPLVQSDEVVETLKMPFFRNS